MTVSTFTRTQIKLLTAALPKLNADLTLEQLIEAVEVEQRAIPPKPKTDVERFWSKVDKSGDCWMWTAALNSRGYGQIGIAKKSIRAHRFSWELANGPIPEGMVIDHICREKKCVKPEHLRVVTQKQNSEHIGLTVKNKSGYRGVNQDPDGRWRAQVKHAGKKIYLGKYDTVEEAAEVALEARLELFTHNDIDRQEAA